jgi:predicted ATPase/class 3 adenylate cyclase
MNPRDAGGARLAANAARVIGMRELPSGTVTFLFTDVEGSTRLLQELGAEGYAESLADHRRIIRRACADEGGIEVDTQGDAFLVAFPEAERAARAADAITGSLGDGRIRVRIGLHTGQPLVGKEGYVGEDVHLGARIAAAGHGGQVLLSRATRDAIGEALVVTDLGEHRLKDIGQAVAIFQLGTDPFAPLKTISNTNLPRLTDTFVGRESELADIATRVRSGSRLVSLVGPGGTGKTRLAIEAASSLLADFKAGVFWIDLSAVRDPAAVPGAVAATLTTEGDLEAHIGEREMLLVLDNLEQVIDSAPWIASLVRACPNLAVLATSRERLRVRGESLVEVPPLGDTDSGQLFADRSGMPRSADSDELCARLEHLPLAVELAAARTASLTPRQILDRLAQRLDLLKGGRDADPRQRTLRATIDWSHGLLDARDRRLLRRLSVFAGGTMLAGVEEVCEGDVDTIESLIDKSLVRSLGGRYTMLETVREYAAEQLKSSGESDAQHARHAAFIRDLMAARIPEVDAGTDDEVGPLLVAEFGNLQAAFAWLVDSGDAAGAAVFIDTVWRFLSQFLSQNRAGLAMCEAVLAMPGLADADRAMIWHREGNFAVQLADRDRARRAWTDAASLAQRIGDVARDGHVLQNLSLITVDPVEAAQLFERSLGLAPPESEREAYKAQWNLAGLKRLAGDAAAADAIIAEFVSWATRVGDYEYIVMGQVEMGERALQRGNAAEALERATRARDLSAARDHAILALIAETLRCRAAARLKLDDDAIHSLANVMELIRHGDIEADEEIAVAAVNTAAELFAAIGEVQLASRLEAVRRRVIQGWPVLRDDESFHDDWLRTHGVEITTGPADVDLTAALDMIRDWLRRSAVPVE